MPSTSEQLSPTRAKLTVEIPFSDLQPAIDKAYKQIASQINVPGFRKGKVPPAVINQRVGRGAVLQEAINEALPDAYGQAVAEHNLRPLAQPEIDITRLQDGDVVEFTAEVDVRPDFEVPDFSQVKVTVDPVAGTDDALDERLGLLRQRFATRVEVERAATAGDIVTIDLAGRQNGEVLPDAEASAITYEVGSGGFIDGLDEAVTGLAAGQDATFASTLVGGAHKDESADITVTVTKVEQQSLPELDDDFASQVSEFDTLDEMKADLRDYVELEARREQVANARDKALEALVDLASFDLPQALVDADVAGRTQQINEQLRRAGLTLEAYLADAEDEEAQTADEFWERIATTSERALRAQILLDKIADDREVAVDQQDLTQIIIAKAQQNGSSPEQELQHMQEHGHMADWLNEARRSKALALIVGGAEITDTEGNAISVAPAIVEADGMVEADETVEADGDPA